MQQPHFSAVFNQRLSRKGLSPGILRGISYARRLIVADLLHGDSDIFEYLKEFSPEMSEGHRPVVREVFLQQHVPVKSSHLRNGKNSYGAEGIGAHRQHLSLGNVGSQLIICGALEPVEGNISGNDVSLQSSLG